MKTQNILWAGIGLTLVGLLASFPPLVRAFRSHSITDQSERISEPPASRTATSSAPLTSCTRLILVPHQGDTPLDKRIIATQQALASGRTPEATAETLGWLFVEKARISYDPGYYKLAEQCALAIDERHRDDPTGLLLRGHVLQNLHQFKQAEPLARQLVAQRGAPFDYGLLGDVLADLGRVDEAISAYQSMMDLRPDSQAHARAAHMRWIRGDTAGAVEAMHDAVRSVGSNTAGSAAWMNGRLAYFRFQSGDMAGAEAACATALASVPNFAPALLLRGRMKLAAGEFADAAKTLRQAVAENPLPEHLWVLSEALRASGEDAEATAAEAKLMHHGIADDPRTVAIFLATHGESLPLALRLAEQELETRGDVFTHDTLAWALAANGRYEEAWNEIGLSLAEGTQDARLFLHAGVIAANLSHADAAKWLVQARRYERLLLPSERKILNETEKLIANCGISLTAHH